MKITNKSFLLWISLLGISSSGFSQSQDIQFKKQGPEIVLSQNMQPAMFSGENETTVVISNPGDDFPYSLHLEMAIGEPVILSQENFQQLGEAKGREIIFEFGADGKLKKDPGKRISFPFTLKVYRNGQLSQFTFGQKSVQELKLGSSEGFQPPGETTDAVKGQRPFEDALNAAEHLRQKDSQLLDALEKYCPGEFSNIGDLQLASQTKNYLLYREIRDLDPGSFSRGRTYSGSVSAQGFSGGGNGLTGILNPTAAADMLGTFIAQRFKQELNIAFLDRFREEIESKPEIRILFPRTADLLMQADVFQYNTFLHSMREAFAADLAKLFPHLEDLMQTPDFANLIKGALTPDGYELLLYSFRVVEMASSGSHPAEIISALDVSAFQNRNLKDGMILLQGFSDAFRDVDRDNGWVSEQKLRRMAGDPQAKRFFISMFLYQERDLLNEIKVRNIPNPETGKPIPEMGLYDLVNYTARVADDVSSSTKTLIHDLTSLVDDLISQASSLQNSLAAWQKPGNGEAMAAPVQIDDFEAFSHYVSEVLEMIRHVVDFSKMIDPLLPTEKWEEVLELSNQVLIVADYTHRKQYGVAITGAVKILSHALPASQAKDQIMKYGGFMVTMVNATTSEEIVKTLEAAALPVGSYRIKRNSLANISLGAYAGGFVAYERLRNNDIPESQKNAPVFGFTAPVGLNFSRGTRKSYGVSGGRSFIPSKFKGNPSFRTKDDKEVVLKGGSVSVFLSIIDVGAVFSLRLQNDSTPLPQLKWENLLAPGAYVVYGIPRAPISLGIGGQMGPQLRSIQVDNNGATANITSGAWRLGGFIAVDIPFFNFYTRNFLRKKK